MPYESRPRPKKSNWLQPKQKLLIPFRVAIALQEDGWLVRNDIIWHKPNAMPSSVKDRLNVTHEYIFHLVKSRRYYYNLDAIREPHKSPPHAIGSITTQGIPRTKRTDIPKSYGKGKNPGDIVSIKRRIGDVHSGEAMANLYRPHKARHEKGKNPGDVIKIGSHHGSSLTKGRATHYEGQIITGHSKGKNPGDVFLKQNNVPSRNINIYKGFNARYQPRSDGKNPGDFWSISTKPFPEAHFAVYPVSLCVKPILSSCPPDGIVLDPMCGSGSTLLAAELINRRLWSKLDYEPNETAKKIDWNLKWIGIEINPEYVEMARRRLKPYIAQDQLTRFLS